MEVYRRKDLKRRRRARYRKGWTAELLAGGLLLLKGYRILSWRYRSGGGEIDLVARRGKKIAFVEVKARRTEIEAMHAVTPKQKKRMFRAADLWMKAHGEYRDYDRSFDLIAVVPWRGAKHHMQFFTW